MKTTNMVNMLFVSLELQILATLQPCKICSSEITQNICLNITAE